ncbi:MAG: ABC transporter ATP-binding protein, partial [Lachnospiraceae bacterium]|nr:ABC transporter ATP-binding protein [Lachnospiraceae bacterium]
MAMDTSGFVPKGNLNTDPDALKKTGRKHTVKRIWQYLGSYRLMIILSMVLALVSVVFTLLVPIMIGRAIDLMADDRQLLISFLLKALIFAAFVLISQFLMNIINNYITYNTVRDIRNSAIRKLQMLPLSYIDSHPKGDIVSRIVADADQFSEGLLMGFTQAFTGIMTIAGTLYFMLSMSVVITIVVVVVTPLSIFIARFISSRTYAMFRKQGVQRGEQTALIEEVIGNEKTVKAFCKEEDLLERFDRINDELTSSSLRAVFFSSLTNPCTRFVNAICYALVALFGALFVLSGNGYITGTITVGTLTVFLSYANQYTKPFNEISSVISELQNAL